jgi:hypothetical protein
MVERLTLKAHLGNDDLGRRHRQALWLLARGEPTAAVLRATGCSATRLNQLVRRYNAEGAAGVGDRRRRNPGAAPMAGCGPAPRSRPGWPTGPDVRSAPSVAGSACAAWATEIVPLGRTV